MPRLGLARTCSPFVPMPAPVFWRQKEGGTCQFGSELAVAVAVATAVAAAVLTMFVLSLLPETFCAECANVLRP